MVKHIETFSLEKKYVSKTNWNNRSKRSNASQGFELFDAKI